ncbi:MAG TPA: malto-oligosyltrehalose synthase [Vicinamibacterales bacterium]|nr:malto-oligosyltrehalose synthase [Vicinamibacterales bacterium]
MPPATLPVSTYRLQFSSAFTFAQATDLVDYLEALGISHCYASSYFKAVPGSTHGYDVTDPTRLNPEIGDESTFRVWVDALRAHGMGHIVDLVPNHMGIAKSANPWWQDVLENGANSRYAAVFDIDWKPLKPELEQKVLLPVLGDTYGAVLERQEIQLEYEDGAFRARYFESVFPIAPGTYGRILGLGQQQLLRDIGEESDEGVEFLSILNAIRHLPGRHGHEPAERAEYDREKEVVKRRLAALTTRSPRVLEHLQRAVAALNGVRGTPRSFDGLDELLSAQFYRLAYWRVAAEEINYRRFFDINELAAIRVEDPAVFERVHAYVFELLRRGDLDGLRIDHVDGLFDPGDYLQRLQARARDARPGFYSAEQPLFLVVEKILGDEERLPDWPVAGATGYDFLVKVNGIFVDRRNERALNEVYERFARLRVPFREIAYRGKQLVLRVSMAGELNVLGHRLNLFSERNRHYRDFTLNALTQAMREIIACFPVYRSYVNDRDEVSAQDRRAIEHAVRGAKHRNPNRPAAVYDFVSDLLLKRASYISDASRDEHMGFVGKFQQVTSPVTAKGIEDTALYLYNRLVSLNEVGGEPDAFGTSPDALHAWLQERARRWPHALSATSTHDTKRSEDVRARLNVLSEVPGAWKQAASRWARLNRRGRSIVDSQSYPSRNEEYLLYQTLLGTWPLETMSPAEEADYRERIVAYMLKAMREAKVFTSWLNPSPAHERAMTRFIDTVLSPENQAFRKDFLQLHADVARYGIYNSLSQMTLKICAPGVPDFYQGSELWNFTLVDPDNRRPVDYTRRSRLLKELDEECERDGCAEVAARVLQSRDDRLKLFATTMLLRARARERDIFTNGDYNPVDVQGSRRDHVFVFARSAGGRRLVVAVPRLVATIAPLPDMAPIGERIWGDTEIVPPFNAGRGGFHNVITDRCVPVQPETGAIRAADAFDRFPVAVLVGSS